MPDFTPRTQAHLFHHNTARDMVTWPYEHALFHPQNDWFCGAEGSPNIAADMEAIEVGSGPPQLLIRAKMMAGSVIQNREVMYVQLVLLLMGC